MENYKILLSQEQIQARIKELAKQISDDYKGKTPVVICMLKGAIYFFADLTRNMSIPVMIEFARLSSYRNGTSSGEMELISDINADITGQDVLIVEDIVDSGKTLAYFISLLNKKHPSSIKICSFLDKKERRQVDINVDYTGFDIPCGFVIGYGLDYAQKYRELPFLAEAVHPENL